MTVDADLYPTIIKIVADLFETTVTGRAHRTNRGMGELVVDNEYAGGISPLTTDADLWSKSIYEEGAKRLEIGQRSYLRYPTLVEAVEGLPEGWEEEVVQEANRRQFARQEAIRAARIERMRKCAEKMAYPAAQAYFLDVLADMVERDEYRSKFVDGDFFELLEPSETDLSSINKRAMAESGSKRAYSPQPGCKATLHMKAAMRIGRAQRAHADHAFYVIPVTLDPECDLEVCKRNLRAFGDAARTANGLAGHGSTYYFYLVETKAGHVVVMDQRSSIAD